jgi:hypothetical protein
MSAAMVCPECNKEPTIRRVSTLVGRKTLVSCENQECINEEVAVDRNTNDAVSRWNRFCQKARFSPVRDWLDRQILVGISATDRACVERLIDDLESA